MSSKPATAMKPVPPGGEAAPDIARRQAPLRHLYRRNPDRARIIDTAVTSSLDVAADNPLNNSVRFGHHGSCELPLGVHGAVGGESDYPVPGEVLSAALAGCLDSATRMIANLMNIRLEHLEVRVSAQVDVRGTLKMDPTVTTGFTDIHVEVRITAAAGTPKSAVARLLDAAEQSCVVLHTLRQPPAITFGRTISDSHSPDPVENRQPNGETR